MTCSYVATRRIDGAPISCSHPAKLRKLGLAQVPLCKCHHTRLARTKKFGAIRFARPRMRIPVNDTSRLSAALSEGGNMNLARP